MDCKSESLSELSKFAMFTQQVTITASISNFININQYLSYSKLMCVTARVLSAFSKSMKSPLCNALNVSNAESIKQAETLWMQEAQRRSKDQIKKGYYERFKLKE